MSYLVVMPLRVAGEAAKYPRRFEELGVDFVGRECSTDEEVIALARDADAVITSGSQRPMPRRVIEKLSRCRIIAVVQIGYDSIDTAAAAERGMLVTNVPGYCIEEVSDHAMALVLACTRRVVSANSAVRSGYWQFGPRSSMITEVIGPGIDRLRGRTLGLFGFGAIARAVVPKAKGFGMRIIACDPYVGSSVAADMGVELVDWATLLQESDFVSIHAALTAETRHVFNREAFGRTKPSSCLVNTARGGFVDEQALYEALTTGKLAMAALDVFDSEPPEPGNPLLSLDNVISTGHCAFSSPQALEVKWRWPVEEVERVLRNEWPIAIVNPQAKERFVSRWGQMVEAAAPQP